MALLDGKQLRDESLSLDKLQGNSGLVTFTSSATMSFGPGTSLTTDDTNINGGTDVVNKNYVDSVAAGLNPKASSRVIYDGDITSISGYTYSNGVSGVGATLTFTASGLISIDSVSLSSGDRVIINSSTDQFVNGIYVYGTTASFFTRATDFDGSPSQEVDGGEYSFVTEGTLNADTGWVVSSPNSTATIGVTPIIWTQFSAAGVITAGDGLFQTGNSFNVGAGTGLTTSSNLVSIDTTGVSANSYGGAGTVGTFTVNAQGQLTTATDVTIDITASQVNDFNTASETAIFTNGNFVDGTTIDFTVTAGDSVTAEVTTGSLTASHLNSNSQGATAGYILSANADGTFAWVSPTDADITGITAGAGLTGGGSSGFITLDVRAENGLTVDGTSDAVELGGTLTKNTTIDGGEFDLTIGNVDYMLFTASSAFDVETNFVSLDSGTGSTQILSGGDTTLSAGGDVDILATGGVYVVGASFSVNGVEIDPTSPTTGYVLTYDGTAFVPQAVAETGDITDVNAGTGLTGGGTQGSVTLSIDTTGVSANSYGGAGTVGTFTVNAQGQLTTATDVTIDITASQVNDFNTAASTEIFDSGNFVDGTTIDFTVTAGTSVTAEVNLTQVAGSLQGQGLTSSAGVINVDLSTTSGLTFSAAGESGQLQVSVDNTTIQINGSGQLISVGGAQPVYSQMSETSVTTPPNTNEVSTTITIDSTPSDYSRVQVFVNGQLQNLGDGVKTTDCYFSATGSVARNISDIVATDTLYWNGGIAGFRLTTSDVISISYEV